MTDDGTLGWLLGGVATILGVMATAVTTLWKNSEAKNAIAIASLEKRADICEDERATLRAEVASLAVEVRYLKEHQPKPKHENDG